MNREQFLALIRMVLLSTGTYMVATGTIDEATLTNMSGAAMTLISGIWSIWDKTDQRIIQKAETLKTTQDEVNG